MNYTFYDPTTGEITGTGGSNGVDILSADNRPHIVGTWHPKNYYLDLATMTPVKKPRDPSGPFKKYTFDWNTKTWQIDLDATADLSRKFRNQLLADIDRVNPIWWASLTQSQQQQLQQYRQDLLDVPQQTGFPESVSWPQKPEWL